MIFAANWKMNLSPQESLSFVQDLTTKIDTNEHKNIWIFPQNYSLGLLEKVLKNCDISWGPQNIYPHKDGAYTGENSANMLKTMGANIALVGHSERRKYFNESDEMVAEKALYLQSQEICPLICIGESIEDRENNQTEKALQQQLIKVLEKIDIEKNFAIAYEPVWAIGSGQVATAEQVAQAHLFIRNLLKERGAKEGSAILYGGSVKAENAASLAGQENVDGFLIGGASLQLESFCQIIEQSK